MRNYLKNKQTQNMEHDNVASKSLRKFELNFFLFNKIYI